MPNLPVTGKMLYDFTLVVILIIIGFGLGLKAGKWWGYVLVAVAVVWAFKLTVILGF